jgi:heat shock protein 90kDa beta
VSSKSPKSDKQYVWEGEAESSSYTIREETDPEKLIPRGTRLTLYLKVCVLILNFFYISCC